ncbi:hypothetical protein SAMN06265371_1105 [Lutibacter agarilyticus]|uniref:Nicotinate-nucleotide adenylyltransferase n=1 Tax=Lutibacter agarilyticus TaxID=1109740 RepID=A0A238YM24_9FLAO|nr:nicotinate-nucleotide adenylyltransferase [Lutibacter agarilyticus]SNR72090.1 hypothetical protein SAMN06265371_1105 [Lutibacter agarilyticus]
MRKLIIGLIIIGFAIQAQAQVEELSEVVVSASNYKYLTKVGLENASVLVSELEEKVANFDLKSADFYSEDNDSYVVSFFIPQGKVLASYDSDGNIIRTVERFNNVKLPREVIESVAKQYPNWTFAKDTYLVNYYDFGKISKRYKITLENGDKRIKIKTDIEGNFI